MSETLELRLTISGILRNLPKVPVMTVMPIVQKSLIAADGGEQTPVPGPRDGTLNLKKCANKGDCPKRKV